MIRVTTEHDGDFHPRMMSYWANAYVEGHVALVFAGHMDGSPRFFRVGLQTGSVEPLGSLEVRYHGTTEGWHWSPQGKLYVLDGPRLRRLNPFDASDDEIVLDISGAHPGCNIWQPQTSDDGRTISATVQRNEGGKIGTVLRHPGGMEFYGSNGALDESIVTRDGSYHVRADGEDNYIVTIATGEQRHIPDIARAVIHWDCGDGFIVGEADKPDPGACVIWDLRKPLTMDHCRILFPTLNQGYVSVRGNRCLHSGDTYLSLVDLGSGEVAPLMAHGGTSDYDGRVKANLSPCGRVATYMNSASGHRDVYLLIV